MKKAFGFVLVFSFVLILSACSDKQNMDEKGMNDSTKDVSTKNTMKSSREDCISGCRVMWKSNKGNEGKPESQMESDCDSLCDAGQGMQNNDADSCAKAEGILKDTCYSDVAKNTNNPALCEKIIDKTFVSACYIAIAEKTGDKALCEKVTDKIMKDVCLGE